MGSVATRNVATSQPNQTPRPCMVEATQVLQHPQLAGIVCITVAHERSKTSSPPLCPHFSTELNSTPPFCSTTHSDLRESCLRDCCLKLGLRISLSCTLILQLWASLDCRDVRARVHFHSAHSFISNQSFGDEASTRFMYGNPNGESFNELSLTPAVPFSRRDDASPLNYEVTIASAPELRRRTRSYSHPLVVLYPTRHPLTALLFDDVKRQSSTARLIYTFTLPYKLSTDANFIPRSHFAIHDIMLAVTL